MRRQLFHSELKPSLTVVYDFKYIFRSDILSMLYGHFMNIAAFICFSTKKKLETSTSQSHAWIPDTKLQLVHFARNKYEQYISI
jgi:hypothetical protein